jgi:hypothetical protein
LFKTMKKKWVPECYLLMDVSLEFNSHYCLHGLLNKVHAVPFGDMEFDGGCQTSAVNTDYFLWSC